jgi:hypothetical protein
VQTGRYVDLSGCRFDFSLGAWIGKVSLGGRLVVGIKTSANQGEEIYLGL